jgi:hypothetical protein
MESFEINNYQNPFLLYGYYVIDYLMSMISEIEEFETKPHS